MIQLLVKTMLQLLLNLILISIFTLWSMVSSYFLNLLLNPVVYFYILYILYILFYSIGIESCQVEFFIIDVSLSLFLFFSRDLFSSSEFIIKDCMVIIVLLNSISYPSIGDRPDRYILRFNEIIEPCRIMYILFYILLSSYFYSSFTSFSIIIISIYSFSYSNSFVLLIDGVLLSYPLFKFYY